jgi:integrase
VMRLETQDVGWGTGRFKVHSIKTKRYAKGGVRVVPIFPELRPYLEAASAAAGSGVVYVVARHRDNSVNLRTQLLRIMKRAGVSPWPKLFQNLRASCETDIGENFPVQVVAAWLGHSPGVALKHYLQVTEDHYRRAAGKAVQKAVQFPVQQPQAAVGGNGQGSGVGGEKPEKTANSADDRSVLPVGATTETARDCAWRDSNPRPAV